MKYVLTYGIACVDKQHGNNEVIAQISDITTDKNDAERLVDLCNEQHLSPVHLQDVINDLIAKL